MWTEMDVKRIQRLTADVTGLTYAGQVEVCEGNELCVDGDKDAVCITAPTTPGLARGFFRLYQDLAAGKTEVHIREKARFESCGCHIDCSRNAVMTVEACKRFIDKMVTLGLNLVVLYTEDTYEVPEYPYMGYLRGKYTQKELRELDDYADSLGVELMPCIQTLGHMEQFLQWQAVAHMKDQAEVLMVDEQETYDLIEAQIRSIRQCMRAKRLHIGMDEAHGVGLGRYYMKHGITDRFELLNRHLDRVVKICEKYDFKPIMWSDMYFRLGSKDNEYYDLEADIPQEVLDKLPPVDMCYWDYYHTDEIWYDKMLEEHARMGENTVFAGGIWTWSGFLPHVDRTWETMEPALRSCARHGVKTVFATMWGDDGQETNHELAMSQMPLFSEFCWRGDECSREEIKAAGELVSGMPKEAYEAFALFYADGRDHRPGKTLVYCDLLYPLYPDKQELGEILERAKKALGILAPYQELQDCRYATKLFSVVEHKAQILLELRERYQAGDKAWMEAMAKEELPQLIAEYEALRAEHKALWERDHKRNGWEVMALRYGGVIGRMQDVQESILRWVSGELDTLCEMDEERLSPARRGSQHYQMHVTPMYNL